MILADLRSYFLEVKSANLLEITQRFAISVDVARDMLALLQRKGKIKRAEDHCGTACVKCSPLTTERYESRE